MSEYDKDMCEDLSRETKDRRSIVIPNMSLPNSDECIEICLYSNGNYFYRTGDGEWIRIRAIELPPHGRLGDLDLLKEDFDASLRATRQLVDLDSDSPFYGLQQRDLANAEKLVDGLIDRTPTVLEASEVKE